MSVPRSKTTYLVKNHGVPGIHFYHGSRNRPPSSPTGWSTDSNGSSVQNEDELCVQVNILSLASSSHVIPGIITSVPFGPYLEGSGQDFAGSSSTDVTRCLSPPSRDTGHATNSKVSTSAESLGEICESGEAVTAAAPEVRYLACPFSKHDPARYEQVCNVCTSGPGWTELKKVLEHIRKVHSRDKRCERCHTRYPKEDEFKNHIFINNCVEVEETDPSRPELMTAEQEKIFGIKFEVMTSENKWRAYYQLLFPDDPNPHSVNPYYNYTTLTHRLEPLAADFARADPSELKARYLACPFSKHNPDRYARVRNSCTTRPGWDKGKRLLEHIRKVHSRDKRCERCHTRYPKRDELKTHILINNCAEVEETDPSRPELMTAEQEKIFGIKFEAMTSENKWRAYYHLLFPDAPNRHSVNPYYDNMTLTHRLGPFAALSTQKRPASPPSNLDDGPQSKRPSREVPAPTPQLRSDPPPPYYGYRSGDRKSGSVNQVTGVMEIGSSKCMDDASRSTDLDFAYGSRNGTIPSSSNPAAPRLLSIPPKFERDDSAIALSSNASGLISSPTRQSQLGSAVQDFDNPIPAAQYDPPNLDPNLPSLVIPPEDQQIYWGVDSEGLLNTDLYEHLDAPDLYGSFYDLDQKLE